MNRLSEKIVLVTGAAGSIGKAVAEAIAAEGGKAVTSDLPGQLGTLHALDVTEELDWLRVISGAGGIYGYRGGVTVVNQGMIASTGTTAAIRFADFPAA